MQSFWCKTMKEGCCISKSGIEFGKGCKTGYIEKKREELMGNHGGGGGVTGGVW